MASEIIIPFELITEILYRLPSKSIGRFRCVSKEWLSLLSSPQFIKTHQNTLNRNYLFYHQTWLTDGSYFIPFHYHEEEKEESVPIKLQLLLPDANPIIIDGSCNGLILLSAFRDDSDHETLVVLNPTTREFVEFPDCDLEGHQIVSCIMRGLGYDSVTDDYKVVTINHLVNLNGADIMCVHVYSLRKNTWTRVMDYPNKYFPFNIKSTALVNGSFHWVATKFSDHTKVIFAFSLADENFSEVPLPTTLCNGNDVDIFCRLSVVDEKLAIFSGLDAKVWLMNEYGVKRSWTTILLHGLNEIRMIGLPFVFYVNGKLLLICRGEMLIYDIEYGRLSKRIRNKDPMAYTFFSCVCVESLVSPRFNRLN
ncbi:F-box/kelch-repeat protein At3g06240-like [Rutidosis leptorrhynchoides]|uniref:F-box/kelch-repeat protein At3g06240-like n=1 Tax=Rutidosis leptorrhynchoides TaxID=125765 RepID=UPI003A99A19A